MVIKNNFQRKNQEISIIVTKEVEPEVEDLPAVELVVVEQPQEEIIQEKSETDETDRGAMLVEEIVQPPQPIVIETHKELVSSSNNVEVLPEQEVAAEVESVKEEPQIEQEQAQPEMEVDEPESVENEPATEEDESAEAPKPLITYNEGQWSPANPSGQCKYDRTQLLQLREAKLSTATPVLKNKKATCIVSSGTQGRPAQNNSLMPTFAKRGQSIGSYSSNNPTMPTFAKPQGGGAPPSRHSAKGSKSGMIHVHLSLREEIKLNESENAWKPGHLKADITPEDDLKKRVRGILNRLTPEKFEVLVSEIMKLQIDTSNKLNDVMILVFEKAIDEPKFSASYASLCRRLATDINVKDDKNETVSTF